MGRTRSDFMAPMSKNLDSVGPAPESAIPDGLPGLWWVAHTKPRNEKLLAAELGQRDVFYYLPLLQRRTRSRRTGRTSRSEVPLFPGYLFLNASEEERLRALRTNRIVHILAVPSQGQLVQELRDIHRAVRSGKPISRHPGLRTGDWVRVVAGPLEGVEGVVLRRLSRLRLGLNVQMLGQSVSLEVEEDLLEPIEGPSYGCGR